MVNYYEEFQKAEQLGEGSIRDLYYVLLSEVESEKNVSKVNALFNVIYDGKLFAKYGDKKIYEEIETDLIYWMKENCELNEYGEVVSFKGE